jgi:ABC-type oligopeptide transport system substrate-binding subunit
MLLLVVACGPEGRGTGPGSAAPGPNTLRFPIGAGFATLDPAYLDTRADAAIAQNLFDGLVKFDDDLRIVPDISAAMPTVSPDGVTYTFRLRHDVVFWNGDRVTAKDVLYSWNRAAALQGPYSTNLAPIAGFDKLSPNPSSPEQVEQQLEEGSPAVTLSGLTAPDGPDGYTVRVKLSQPTGWFLSAISQPGVTAMIVDEKAVHAAPMTWWQRPATLVGTGAYRMTSPVSNQAADFEAVSGWWGAQRPAVQHVHIDVVPYASDRELAYEAGGYDINGYGGYSNVDLHDILRIRATPRLSSQLLLRTGGRSYWVSFNLANDGQRAAGGPFVDGLGAPAKDLRLAFSLAVDKKKLVSTVCRDVLCTAATGGIIPKGLRGYAGDNADPLGAFDPVRARQLLRAADPDGSKTKGLVYVYDPEDPVNQPTAQALQRQWRANLGVDVQVRPETHVQFVKDRLAGRFVLSRDGWEADYDHPQDWFDDRYGTLAGCPDVNCSSGYVNAQFDRLAAQADARSLDQALPVYAQMSRLLSEEAAYIPLYYTVNAFMIKPYVKGAGSTSLLDLPWAGIQILPH